MQCQESLKEKMTEELTILMSAAVSPLMLLIDSAAGQIDDKYWYSSTWPCTPSMQLRGDKEMKQYCFHTSAHALGCQWCYVLNALYQK